MRKRTLLLPIFVLCLQTAGLADEKLATLRVGQDVYTDVTITSVTATDIYFTHSHGMGNAKLRKLDPALQQHFHFDPARADARQAEQQQANASYVKSVRETRHAAKAPEPAAAAEVSEAIVPPHPIYAKSFLGQRVPELTIEKWLTEAPDIHGKFVLLDFWATWCGPCRRSIPELNEFQARFKDRLVVIGLSAETEQAVRNMKTPAIDYSVAIDTQRRTASTVEVRGIPHTMLVDPHGIVRFEGMPGYLNDESLEKLLARYSQ